MDFSLKLRFFRNYPQLKLFIEFTPFLSYQLAPSGAAIPNSKLDKNLWIEKKTFISGRFVSLPGCQKLSPVQADFHHVAVSKIFYEKLPMI